MSPAEFLQTIENTMAMKNGDWLEEQMRNDENIIIIDLRGRSAWEEEHLEGSINVSIQELPERAASIIPDNDSTVVCLCNGSIQSAMAVMYLRTENYKNSFNLSGGFSGWVKNSRPLISI